MPITGFCYIILYLPKVMHNVCAQSIAPMFVFICTYIYLYNKGN